MDTQADTPPIQLGAPYPVYVAWAKKGCQIEIEQLLDNRAKLTLTGELRAGGADEHVEVLTLEALRALWERIGLFLRSVGGVKEAGNEAAES